LINIEQHLVKNFNASLSITSDELSSQGVKDDFAKYDFAKDLNEIPTVNIETEKRLEEQIPIPNQFLAVLNAPSPVDMRSKKPRGSFIQNDVKGPQMAVERMDSIKSVNDKVYLDPFMRTNQALLKRLDSISTLLNKDATAHPNSSGFANNYSGHISQASNRFGARDTPAFIRDVTRQGTPEIDDTSSLNVPINYNNKRGSAIFMPLQALKMQKLANNQFQKPKEAFSKSEMSAVSMNEILDFEDYVPFKPNQNLEQIDEEKALGLDIDREGHKSSITDSLIFNTPNVISFKEARMSEEESFDTREIGEELDDEGNESEDNVSEHHGNLRVTLPDAKPKKSSTFTSFQLNEGNIRSNAKTPSLYRKNRGISNMKESDSYQYSHENAGLNSIRTSRHGTKSEILTNPMTLNRKLK
jgi:hypothetical protein